MMFEEQKTVKRIEAIAKRSELKAKIQFNLVDAFIFLERIEEGAAKKELRNILLRINTYVEEQ